MNSENIRDRERYFTAKDGTRIWYKHIKSKSDKSCLVFLHGLTGSSSGWDFIYPHYVKKGFSVLLMDARGHGLSDIPPDPKNITLTKIAEDLNQVINEKRIGRIVLIGHSHGGIIAQKFYERYPENVNAMILISTAHKIAAEKKKYILSQMLYYGTYFLFSVIHPLRFEKTNKQVDYSEFVPTHDLNLKRIYYDLRVTSLKTFLPFFREIIETGFTELLKKLDIPVLIIHGKNDLIFSPDIARNMHKMIKNSVLSVIDTNHVSIINAPRKIIRLIDKFLTRHSD